MGEGVESWKQRGLVERKGSLHFGCPATRFLLKLKESGNSRPQGTCSTARPPFAEAVSCGGTRPLVIDAQEAFARAHSGAGQGLCAAAEVGSAPRLVAGRGEQGRLSETVTTLRAPRVPGPVDAHDGMPHLQACTAEHAHAAVGDAPWVGDGIWLRAACQRALFRPSHVF